MSNINIEPSWKEVLRDYFETPEFLQLTSKVKTEYQTKKVYPKPEDIFRAFWLTPFETVQVVILGQDPYHGAGQAHGLSFSVQKGTRLPPSLQNIYKEISREFNIQKDMTDGDLSIWARQGVFLLNSILSVQANTPTSHKLLGWEGFTDHVIHTLSLQRKNLVFMLWGSYAKNKKHLIDHTKHLILVSPHPSPYSAHTGFFGNNHFIDCNSYLQNHGKNAIKW
jgi:uracil-DNA glycosylase